MIEKGWTETALDEERDKRLKWDLRNRKGKIFKDRIIWIKKICIDLNRINHGMEWETCLYAEDLFLALHDLS